MRQKGSHSGKLCSVKLHRATVQTVSTRHNVLEGGCDKILHHSGSEVFDGSLKGLLVMPPANATVSERGAGGGSGCRSGTARSSSGSRMTVR